MDIYSEDQIKTWYKCPTLYKLGGHSYEFTPSQKFLFSVIKKFNLKLLKNEINNFDYDLVSIIKKEIPVYFSHLTTFDDLQHLTNWTISLVNDFFQIFNIIKYSPIVTDHKPNIVINKLKLSLNIDLLLSQNNKMNFIHAIHFVPKVDLHYQKNDLFNAIKLKYLNKIYNRRKYSKPPVSIHLLSIEPLVFTNKNKRNYTFTHRVINEYDESDYKNAVALIDYFSQNKNFNLIKPFCDNYTCPKRKECDYD